MPLTLKISQLVTGTISYSDEELKAILAVIASEEGTTPNAVSIDDFKDHVADDAAEETLTVWLDDNTTTPPAFGAVEVEVVEGDLPPIEEEPVAVDTPIDDIDAESDEPEEEADEQDL